MSRRTLGVLCLIGTIGCWGCTPIMLRYLTTFVDAWTANGIRYPLAAILYWPLLVWAYRQRRLDFKFVRSCLFPAFFSFAGQVFWALSHYHLQASEVGFLVRLASFWAVAGSMILFRDERQLLRFKTFYVGVLMLVIGFLAFSAFKTPSNDQVESLHSGSRVLGLIYIVLCGMFFGGYVVSVRKCIPNADPVLSFGVVANVVSIGTLTGMALRGNVADLANQTPQSWTLLIGSSILGIAIGHILLYVAVQRLGAAITASCQNMLPFVTATIAGVVLSESLAIGQWFGGSLMIVGALLLLTMKNTVAESTSK